jgi:hypothetical protein
MMSDEHRRQSSVHHSSFIVHHSVEEVFPPGLVGSAKVSDDLPVHMKIVSLRSLHQSHARVFRRVVALPIVAGTAASHQVLPSRVSAARAWRDVIQREVLGREHAPAVLTGIMIAKQDVFAREAFSFERDVNVLNEPNNRWHRHRESRRMKPLSGALFRVGNSFENQHNRATGRAYIYRLEGRVQN